MPRTIEWKSSPPDPIGVWRQRVVADINTYESELEDEFGNFTIEEIPNSPEVKLIPEGFGPAHRAYMSDHHADARLVIDDYWPTDEDRQLGENQVSDQ